jgi:sorbitol-specific phosphotransferase system component IIC
MRLQKNYSRKTLYLIMLGTDNNYSDYERCFRNKGLCFRIAVLRATSRKLSNFVVSLLDLLLSLFLDHPFAFVRQICPRRCCWSVAATKSIDKITTSRHGHLRCTYSFLVVDCVALFLGSFPEEKVLPNFVLLSFS